MRTQLVLDTAKPGGPNSHVSGSVRYCMMFIRFSCQKIYKRPPGEHNHHLVLTLGLELPWSKIPVLHDS